MALSGDQKCLCLGESLNICATSRFILDNELYSYEGKAKSVKTAVHGKLEETSKPSFRSWTGPFRQIVSLSSLFGLKGQSKVFKKEGPFTQLLCLRESAVIPLVPVSAGWCLLKTWNHWSTDVDSRISVARLATNKGRLLFLTLALKTCCAVSSYKHFRIAQCHSFLGITLQAISKKRSLKFQLRN